MKSSERDWRLMKSSERGLEVNAELREVTGG